MLVLTEEIVRRWSLPFALGCEAWKLTKTGVWLQHCGDIVLRVSLVHSSVVGNPNEGLYVKPWLMGAVKLRIDGAVLPLSDTTLIQLWVHVSAMLSTHGVTLLQEGTE